MPQKHLTRSKYIYFITGRLKTCNKSYKKHLLRNIVYFMSHVWTVLDNIIIMRLVQTGFSITARYKKLILGTYNDDDSIPVTIQAVPIIHTCSLVSSRPKYLILTALTCSF